MKSLLNNFLMTLAGLKNLLRLPTIELTSCLRCGTSLPEPDGRCPNCGEFWGPMP